MEGWGQIILLAVLGIASAAINAVNKKKKQKAEEAQHQQGGEEKKPTFIETVQSLFGDDPFDFESQPKPSEPSQKEEWSPRHEGKYAHPGFSQDKFQSEGRKAYSSVTPDAEYAKTRNKPMPGNYISESAIGREKSVAVVKSEDQGSSFLDDFDIRKAIIYSEIMTPKFKE